MTDKVQLYALYGGVMGLICFGLLFSGTSVTPPEEKAQQEQATEETMQSLMLAEVAAEMEQAIEEEQATTEEDQVAEENEQETKEATEADDDKDDAYSGKKWWETDDDDDNVYKRCLKMKKYHKKKMYAAKKKSDYQKFSFKLCDPTELKIKTKIIVKGQELVLDDEKKAKIEKHLKALAEDLGFETDDLVLSEYKEKKDDDDYKGVDFKAWCQKWGQGYCGQYHDWKCPPQNCTLPDCPKHRGYCNPHLMGYGSPIYIFCGPEPGDLEVLLGGDLSSKGSEEKSAEKSCMKPCPKPCTKSKAEYKGDKSVPDCIMKELKESKESKMSTKSKKKEKESTNRPLRFLWE